MGPNSHSPRPSRGRDADTLGFVTTVHELRTDELGAAAPLLDRLPHARGALAFVRHGRGIAGWGEAHRLDVRGTDAAARIQAWFDDIVRSAAAAGEAEPVVFVSLGFSPEDASVAVVPRVAWRSGPDGVQQILGDRGARSRPTPTRITRPGTIRWSDPEQSALGYRAAVASAVQAIRAGELGKVVLSHDLTAVTESDVDERFLLGALADRYPSCWAYAVDQLVGASPEMLVERHRDNGRLVVTSRVLAGTGWAEHLGDPVIADLLASAKNRSEHRYAVDSVASVLRGVSTHLDVPPEPRALVLANLVHLATDVVGELADPAPSALQLAAALHPTGAVGGYPRDAALELIRRLEGRPRGRYAAPVGWMDARGDGEFALALRGAVVDGRTVRLTAGGGLVADSDPDSEVREAQVKMIPMRDALES